MHKLTLLVVPFLFASLPAFGAKGATSYFCEADGGTQAKAKIVVKPESGHTLFACGKTKKSKGAWELSSFKVFVVSKAGRKNKAPVFEDSSAAVYRVTNTSGSLVLQELISDGKNRIPAYELEISCDEKSCKRSAKKCVFEAPSGVPPKALAQVKAYMSGPLRGKAPPVALIHALARLAYSGNAEAVKLFQDRGPLSLDGEASDAYFDHGAVLAKLKQDCSAQPASGEE